jgi:indolepyruvate ferredoxin oxidoreductase, beta subunit
VSADRPLTLLIAALGGEGGGVLADWIVGAAASLGYPVQSTSIPGVAQRTGSTTYYIELWPHGGEARPVMALAPAPGDVDVMLASELLEAGRALLGGFVTSGRTTLIASTHRVYTVAEKMQMGDGRFESKRVLEAAAALSQRAILFDMQAAALRSGSVINAVLFGALAASGALPLPRTACEQAIRRAGKGTEASLKGFDTGYSSVNAAFEGAPQPLSLSTRELIDHGVRRLTDYQDERYARLYLDRMARLPASDAVIAEAARYLALWMSYEDVIRVADLKTRRSRIERIRTEVKARPQEPVRVVDYFKPRVEEVAALLPAFAARPLRRWRELALGLHIQSTGLTGFLMLRCLAALRPLRRSMSRYADEQRLIERWLAAVAGAKDVAAAAELAACGRLIKGYSDTHRRGQANLVRILDTLGGADAAAIREAREAALGDPEGRGLENALAARGIEALPPLAKPLTFFRRPTDAPRKAA